MVAEKIVLTLVGELLGLFERDEFCSGLLQAVREAVPSEFCALNELPADLPYTISLTDPPVPLELHEAFARYGTQNPIADYFIRTGEGRATRMSDLVTRQQLHSLDVYQHVYRPLGVEYQIAFTLPSGAGHILGISLSRKQRDFTTREQNLLNLARPYLVQLYRNTFIHGRQTNGAVHQLPLEPLRALGLTRREAEVLRLVASGHSAADAAARLDISVRTVQKHLERCYRTLGVAGRSQASRRAWEAAASER